MDDPGQDGLDPVGGLAVAGHQDLVGAFGQGRVGEAGDRNSRCAGSRADAEQIEEYCDPFEERKKDAYIVQGCEADGRIRLLSPFHAGKLHARTWDREVPRPESGATLVQVPEGTEPPQATITLHPDDPGVMWQPFL